MVAKQGNIGRHRPLLQYKINEVWKSFRRTDLKITCIQKWSSNSPFTLLQTDALWCKVHEFGKREWTKFLMTDLILARHEHRKKGGRRRGRERERKEFNPATLRMQVLSFPGGWITLGTFTGGCCVLLRTVAAVPVFSCRWNIKT